MGGISVWQLLIILAIVLVLFGAKRLRNVGSDLGAAVKGFRGAMREGEGEQEDSEGKQRSAGNLEGDSDDDRTFEGEARPKRESQEDSERH
jgi:sec-independent protein translocase protein TatA